jgi:hypothetical protein
MTKTILLWIVAGATVVAGWHPLKLMSTYHGKDFHLKPGVEYVEVHLHDTFIPDDHKPSLFTKRIIQMYRKPLKSYGSKSLRAFRHTTATGSKRYGFLRGSAGLMTGSRSWYFNGTMLDSQHKLWHLETTRDLIDMVLPIDTPAEVKLVMWAHKRAEWFVTFHEEYHAKYKRSGSRYLVEEHYSITDTAYGECGIYTYRYSIDRQGHMSKGKLIRKRPSKICGGE